MYTKLQSIKMWCTYVSLVEHAKLTFRVNFRTTWPGTNKMKFISNFGFIFYT